MAKNRKNQMGFRLGPLVNACLICVFIGGSGVGYVWQKAVIDQLGRDITTRETRLIVLQDKNESLRKQLAAMQSPPVLEMRIRELNLGLAMPHPSQVLRLFEPVSPQTQASDARRQYAARTDSEIHTR